MTELDTSLQHAQHWSLTISLCLTAILWFRHYYLCLAREKLRFGVVSHLAEVTEPGNFRATIQIQPTGTQSQHAGLSYVVVHPYNLHCLSRCSARAPSFQQADQVNFCAYLLCGQDNGNSPCCPWVRERIIPTNTFKCACRCSQQEARYSEYPSTCGSWPAQA